MRTILFIDDDDSVLMTLSALFRSAGYCCVASSSLEQAERAFVANHIDLVVVDHGVNRVNGAQIARHLKRIRAVSVLMLTGNTEVIAAPISVDFLLHKPMEPEDLLTAVDAIFRRSDAVTSGSV